MPVAKAISRGAIRSLVTPRWHYIVHEKLGAELYDWLEDPGERKNLARRPEGRALIADLAQRLQMMLASTAK